jgi:hypothetical protein
MARKHTRKNRSYRRNGATTWLLVGGVVVAAGVGYYFYTRKPAPEDAAKPGTTPATPATPGTPSVSPGIPAIAPALPAGLPADLKAQMDAMLANAAIPAACKENVKKLAIPMAAYFQAQAACLAAPGSAVCATIPGLTAQIDALNAQGKSAGCDKYLPQS